MGNNAQGTNAANESTSARLALVPSTEHPWALDGIEVARTLGVDAATGLTHDDAARRLATHGPNTLERAPPRPAFDVLIAQFKSLLVGLLALAALASLLSGHVAEALAVGLVLAVNAVLGFAIELRATRSMEALAEMGDTAQATWRSGVLSPVPASTLVPGDIVQLDAGEVVGADCRLLQASKLEVDEASFTGESVPVQKSIAPVAEGARLADRTSMLFRGTSMTRGSALAIVVRTGANTELGAISHLIAGAEAQSTPLEQRLASLGRGFVWVTLALCIAVLISGVLAGNDMLTLVQTVVALAVATVPEGLPVIATIALARGVQRMARHNAVVRRLSAVETLGATSVLCTDKTGTLTENKMIVREVVGATGTFTLEGDAFSARECSADAAECDHILTLGALCNNASVDGETVLTGDPMEAALLIAAQRGGLDLGVLDADNEEMQEVAFDNDTNMMATIHRVRGDARFRYAIKGAPESVFAASSLDRQAQTIWAARAEAMAARGLRVLAVAEKKAKRADERPYTGISLVGLVGFLDPPRPDVPNTIAACRRAGMKVVMITGDHPTTAYVIGREVGVADEGAYARMGETIDDALTRNDPSLTETTVFARVSPEEKLLLIRAHQAKGAVVAMLGDGVNDAPALKKADIGVAMGERGTDVARQAADLVLKDDRLATVLMAVREGRVIFDNLRTFVVYLLSCNVSEVLIVGLAAVFGAVMPLSALQILFLNLITDVFPALALGVGEGSSRIMERPPRRSDEEILNAAQWRVIAAHGAALTLSGLGALAIALGPLGLSNPEARSVVFLTVGLGQVFHVFNMRAANTNFIVNEVTRNPWVWGAIALSGGLVLLGVTAPPLTALLGGAALSPAGWLVGGASSFAPFLVGQVLLSLGLIDHTANKREQP